MSDVHVISAPTSAESLRVCLVDERQLWNIDAVRVSERWATFRSGGTRYDVPLTSIVSIETHTAAGSQDPDLHDGHHGPTCIVCFPQHVGVTNES